MILKTWSEHKAPSQDDYSTNTHNLAVKLPSYSVCELVHALGLSKNWQC